MSIPVVGLTGGIGSGKSTVVNYFHAFGIQSCSADDSAKHLSQPGQACYDTIVGLFGNAICNPDGSLKRRAMAEIIFHDKAMKAALEAILHPAIRQHMNATAATLDGPYCLFEIPLLLETKQADRFQQLVVVHCDASERKQRLIETRGMDPALIEQIMEQQVSDQQRRAATTNIIDNNADLKALWRAVCHCHWQLCQQLEIS